MLSFFPRDVLDEIWELNESDSEGFHTCFDRTKTDIDFCVQSEESVFFVICTSENRSAALHSVTRTTII